ncbi:MAG: PBSX family phage terminase large subunit [Elusimicrobiaceae bacterium]|nr:PBSX family phage terminase large subunit [Elusimicrobiaceae bacterium]
MTSKTKIIKVSKVFQKTFKANTTTVINVGGARSGKSYAMAQLLIYKAVNEICQIAITRKTMPALKMTAMRLIINLLKEYNLFAPACFNKTENIYKMGRSSFQFFSLDDPEKIKSSEFNYIWMEEATEFNYQDYSVLLTRLSAPIINGKQNQIFLTLNPTDINSWIYKKLFTQKDITVIKSTYKDNNFLQESYIKTLLSLKNYDKNAYQVFTLGEWGKSEKIIYKNWALIDEIPTNSTEIFYGLDFGFNNPTALVQITVYDGKFYVNEILYQSGLTNSALIEKLKILLKDFESKIIYADAAEPNRIAEIELAGFNIKAAQKNVLNGIMSVKSDSFFVTKSSVNLIKELQSYSWKSDANGNILEEPIKFNDHLVDAMRYAIYTYRNELNQSTVADINFI